MNEALIARGGVPVELDRTRIVFFDKYAAFLLIQKYGDEYLSALFAAGKAKDGRPTARLKDVDALEYFLWAGLQAECRATEEKLVAETVGEWILPSTLTRIFNAVTSAIVLGIHTPPLPGKAAAATASPAAPAKHRASTSPRRKDSRSPSSAKARKPSGTRR